MSQTVVANSTIAGAASYPVFAAAISAILTIAGIAIPPFTIGAFTIGAFTATGMVVTQTMDISALATILSYITIHYTPDSVAQNIVALAKFAPKVLAMIPKTYSGSENYVIGKNGELPPAVPLQTVSNIHPTSAAAIAVIQAHAAGFPPEVKS